MSILLSFQDSIVHDILKISDFFSSFIGQLLVLILRIVFMLEILKLRNS